jgi:hypothetical protein
MFGKGVYFADSSSKSANYVYPSQENNVGFMLLCETALGRMNELTHAQYMDKPPKGYHSTKGLGTSEPEDTGKKVIDGGVIVPMGKLKAQGGRGSTLLYNEYIVYDVAQIRQRYLLKIKFNFKRGGFY